MVQRKADLTRPLTARKAPIARRLAGLVLGASLLATACASSADISASSVADGAPATDAATSSQPADAENGSTDGADGAAAQSGAQTAAQSGPITWQQLVDPTGAGAIADAQVELDQAAADASEAAVRLDSCPLLSDATVIASVAGSQSDLPTTEAKNDTCTWFYPGRSFTVLVEAAAEVDTTDHSGRAYNIDVEPVVTPQSGPGTNAVILSDTAFEELGGGPLEYLFFFVQGDEAVTLRMSGLEMKPGSWRTMADEVASNLAAGNGGLAAAAALEAASRVQAETTDVAGSEPCTYLGTAQVAELLGIAGTPLTVSVAQRGGSVFCEWEAASGHRLAIFARTNDDRGPDYYLSINAQDVTGQVGQPAIFENGFRTIFFLPGDIEGLDTWDSIEVSAPGDASINVAAALAGRVVAS